MKTFQASTARAAIMEALEGLLRPYQLLWIHQAGLYKWLGMIGARQVGKDTAWACLPVVDGMSRQHQWNLISSTERQAKLWMKDVRKWVHAIKKAVKMLCGLDLPGIAQGRRQDDNKTAIELTNGSLIICHPATVRATVGVRGSVAFNEVGQLPHAQELFQAVLPIVEGQRDNNVDAHFIIFSNATHEGHWLHQWWTNANPQEAGSSKDFAKITYTYDNFLDDMGYSPAEQEVLRGRKQRALGMEAYRQWYGCEWRGLGGSYLDPAMLSRQTWTVDQLQKFVRIGCTLGYDPGRHVDPAAIVPLHLTQLGDRFASRSWAEVNVPYAAQRLHIQRMAQEHGPCFGTGVDSTGPQCQATEELQNDPRITSAGEIVPFPMGYASKWRLFRGIREGLEQRKLWLAPDDLDMKMQLGAIRYGSTATGMPRLEWSRSKGPDGQVQHGDKGVGLGLAEAVVRELGLQSWAA